MAVTVMNVLWSWPALRIAVWQQRLETTLMPLRAARGGIGRG